MVKRQTSALNGTENKVCVQYMAYAMDFPAHLQLLGSEPGDDTNLATFLVGVILSSFHPTVQLGGEMSELDDAGTYFDLGPRKVTKTGTYYYMCTRNNNFTNRSQKGKVIVQDNAVMFSRVGSAGGTVQLSG